MSLDFNTAASHMLLTAAVHPLNYAKILVQLGHEPMEPTIKRNLLFRRQLFYPGLLSYVKHIRSVDGTLGLYRGLVPRLLANFSTTITYVKVSSLVGLNHNQTKKDEEDNDIKTVTIKLCEESVQEIAAKCCAVIASQPFHVISIRMMAQFVGRESAYNGLFPSIQEIYNTEGILGFFAGLFPRMAAETLTIIIANIINHLFNTYLLNKKNELQEFRQYSSTVTGFIASSIVYPVQLTSTIMAANGAALAIAGPPLTPVFNSWFDCLSYLRTNNFSSRGSSMFFRKVTGHVISATSVMPAPPPTF